MDNWRMLENEIVTVLRTHGYELDENPDIGDKLLDVRVETYLNITEFARALSERVEVKSNAVRVTI